MILPRILLLATSTANYRQNRTQASPLFSYIHLIIALYPFYAQDFPGLDHTSQNVTPGLDLYTQIPKSEIQLKNGNAVGLSLVGFPIIL